MYAAMTSFEDDKADGTFSATCYGRRGVPMAHFLSLTPCCHGPGSGMLRAARYPLALQTCFHPQAHLEVQMGLVPPGIS
jgi:hypothetical protein